MNIIEILFLLIIVWAIILKWKGAGNIDDQKFVDFTKLKGTQKKFQLYITPKVEEGGMKDYLVLYGHPDSDMPGHNKGKFFYATLLSKYSNMSEAIEKVKNFYKEAGHSIEEINWNPIQLEVETK